jgi:hypothetical protein
MQDAAGLELHTRLELKKFDGDVPPGCEDPEAAGFRLLETIVVEDGVETERTIHAAD